MRGSLYLKTLRDLQGQTLAWSLGLIGIAAVNVLLYPTVQNLPGLISFLENLPPAFKAMIGDLEAMGRLEGFLRVKVFDVMPLLLSVFVVSQGSALVAGEIEQKSLDLLLARPIPRSRVALAKFGALATAALALVLALALGLVVSARFVETDLAPDYLVIASLNALPLSWLFAALAVLASCALSRARHAALAVGGFVIASYVYETLRLISMRLRPLDEFSLFAWQKAGVTLDGTVHAGPILLLLLLTLGVVALAAVVLERRDLAG